jgi:NADH-quinone oxidoreductase subunit G
MDSLVEKGSLVYDKTKCIGCARCVKRCEKIGICHLGIEGIGKNANLIFNDAIPCVQCGQCTLVCPVKSMIEHNDVDKVEQLLKNKGEKLIIVQCAPAVRTSINELFKMEHSPSIEKKLNSALKKVGFDKVFDVNFGADITSYVESEELVERIENNGVFPMFTSCCPSWILYVEQKKPFLKPNLTTAFSPHIHSGICYKTWWAEKNNVKPQNIVVVSIMPCLSKKHEANLEKSSINGLKAVDYVLTVRELGQLFKNNNVNLEEQEEFDGDELAKYTGAGAIYGTSGGVMESALRIAYKRLNHKDLENIELTEVRCGFEGLKSAEINMGEKIIKIAVMSSPINVGKFIDDEEYKKYHYIEVMNCLGGCINGGGQPLLPMKAELEEELIAKRRSVLYSIDKNKVKRNALDNKIMMEYVSWVEENGFRKNLFCEE